MKKNSNTVEKKRSFNPKGIIYLIIIALIVGYFFALPLYFNFKVLYTLFNEQFMVKLSLYLIGLIWGLLIASLLFLIMFIVTPLRNIVKNEIGKNAAGKLIYLILFFLIF